MKKLALGFSLTLGLIGNSFALPTDPNISSVTNSLPISTSPETIHQLFKSCKKGKALYGCELSGKIITAAFTKTKSSTSVPAMTADNIYSLYWWPKNCTPPADIKDSTSCPFNLLIQAGALDASSSKKKG